MNKFLATTALVSALACAAPAMAQEEQQCNGNASVGNDTGRLFAKQGLDFYQGSTGIFDFTLTCGRFYGNLWHAETGFQTFNETDGRVGVTGQITSDLSYDASVAIYVIDGPEAYELSGAVTYTINDNWSLKGDIDIIRGGFNTDVFFGEVRWSDELFGNVSGSASAGVSFDTWSRDTVGHLNLGASIPIWALTGSASVQGFTVLEEGNPALSNDDDAVIGSLSLSYDF